MGTDAALRVVWAPMPHWNAIALSPVVGEHCEVAAHGCFNRGPAFKGDNYVSKALVGIIFDAFWPSAALLACLLVSYRTLAQFFHSFALPRYGCTDQS